MGARRQQDPHRGAQIRGAGHHQPGRDRVHGARCHTRTQGVEPSRPTAPGSCSEDHRARAQSLLPSAARDLHGAGLRWWRPRPAHAAQRNEPELFARRHAGRVPRGPGTARRVCSHPSRTEGRLGDVPTRHRHTHRRTRWLRLRGERRRHRLCIGSRPTFLGSPRAGLPTDGGSCSRMGSRSTSFTPTGQGFGASRWSRFRDCVKRSTRHGLPTVRASCSSDGRAPIEINLFTARKDGTDVEQITHTHGIVYGSTDWGTNAG